MGLVAAPGPAANRNRGSAATGCVAMAAAEEYDRYASECLRMAASASDERQRRLFIEMALAFVRLARRSRRAFSSK